MSEVHSELASQIGYVRTEDAPLLPPPASEAGFQGWLRQNFLNSVTDFSSIGAAISSLLMLILTVGALYFGVSVAWGIISFSFIEAVWTDPEGLKREVCATVAQGGPHPQDWFGACWPYVDAKWKAFTYGRYPESELWRPDLVFLIGSVGVAWLVSDSVPRRWLWGFVMIALGAVLFWWSTQPIENDGAALFNDVYDPAMASPMGYFFDYTPIGAWILVAVGALFVLLAKPVGRKLVAVLMLTVFPVFAYLLLTGGDAEGSVDFWIGLGVFAAFGLALWLVASLLGANAFSALLLSLAIIAAIAYFVWSFIEPTTGYALTDAGLSREGQGSVIRLPLPVALLGKISAGIGALVILYVMTAGRAINLVVRLIIAIPALVMIAGAYGGGPLETASLPVGWLIFALLLVVLIGFALMALNGMNRPEWHEAIAGFSKSTGKTILILSLIVGVVAFVGGPWFVDLIELASAGRMDQFLSPEHLAAHTHLASGEESAVTALDIPRDVWPLPEVETNLWGGLLVTLVVAIAGIVVSLPLGILLALGRRSTLPAVRILSTVFIEFWRGVPLITVLFMASVMLPLFLPEGTEFNKLLRALIGVALFASAYMAEVVRGGLQAISKGQYEGADSLGLGYAQKMRLIVMPQALTLVIPGIVNTFIGLFKDTVLVLIIGLFDLLGMVQNSFSDSSWAVPVTNPTGYLLTAAIFFIFCFGMSRYSMFMERRLRRGHAR